MALSKTLSAAVYGIDANLIDVEVDYRAALSPRGLLSHRGPAGCGSAREP